MKRCKSILLAAALAITALPTIAEDKATPLYGRGADACPTGQARTCTIQCDPGTRYGIERLYGAPGVEVCAVSNCRCQQLPPPPAWLPPQPQATSVQELAVPLAFVIFGFEYLLADQRR